MSISELDNGASAQRVKRRTLGQSGVSIPEISFGCGPTARLMVGDDRDLRLRAVKRALDLGVDCFDTAAMYGEGRSETHLGEAFQELGVRPLVATKVTLEAEHFSDIKGAVMRSVAGSLARLRLDRLDIVHLHNRFGAARAVRGQSGLGAVLTPDDAIGPGGVADALDELHAQGLVGAIGCCAFGGEPPAIRRVLESARFHAVIVNYSLLNTTAWSSPPDAGIRDYGGVARRAAELGMGVVALRVLEGGVLASAPARALQASDAFPGRGADFERAARLDMLTETPEETLVKPAIRFALSNPSVSTVVVGFSDIAQIEEAAQAAASGALPANMLAQIENLRVLDFGRRPS